MINARFDLSYEFNYQDTVTCQVIAKTENPCTFLVQLPMPYPENSVNGLIPCGTDFLCIDSAANTVKLDDLPMWSKETAAMFPYFVAE